MIWVVSSRPCVDWCSCEATQASASPNASASAGELSGLQTPAKGKLQVDRTRDLDMDQDTENGTWTLHLSVDHGTRA